MRILYRYITRECLVAFVVTLLVFMFVMAVGNVFKIIDYFARGVSGRLILQVFSYGIPFSLIFAIPMSVLAAVFLTYSRMASEREIVAMQACGVSIWQIIRPPLLFSLLAVAACVYINADLAPASHFARRLVVEQLKVETPLSFLDEGRFIRDLPGYTIYIGRKQGPIVYDVVIYEFGEFGPQQTVRADSGEIVADPANPSQIMINLRQVRIEQADEDDPADLQLMRRISAAEYPVVFDMSELIRSGIIWKKRADLSMQEIVNAVRADYLLRPGDIRDLPELMRALRLQPLAGAVSRTFAPATRLLLDATARGTVSPAALKLRLAQEFNTLIDGPVLYDPEIFAEVELDQYVRPLLDQAPAGNERRRLNRMLLEHLFPLQLENHYLSHVAEEEMPQARMALMLEASTRMALSFSCFAFSLLGVGLGIRIHRRESYVGMAMALVLVFVFYFFIILADALVSRPQLYPQLIVWIPFFASILIAVFLLRRAR